jgi:hypothetical protein
MPPDRPSDLLSRIDERTKTTAEAVERIEYVLEGNGSPGLIRDVDRLKQSEERRTRLLWVIMSGVVLLGVNAMWDRVFAPPVITPVLQGPIQEPRK